jgi:D-sedoheptulose 7-phosphate isomerase
MASADQDAVAARQDSAAAPTDAAALAEAAIRDSIDVHSRLLDTPALAAVVEAAGMVSRCLLRGGKLLLFGNGGSASDAAHVAAEFVGRFQRERRAFPAIALATNDSSLTAIANDFGFEHVFVRQVEAFGTPGDVAIAISTSGKSPNVLAGVRTARQFGLGTIGLTGGEANDLAAEVDIALQIPSGNTARIQEGHILVAHLLCELVERELA